MTKVELLKLLENILDEFNLSDNPYTYTLDDGDEVEVGESLATYLDMIQDVLYNDLDSGYDEAL